MSGAEIASRWGFDPDRLRFASRTALAACLALLAGWMLGLEHPQWSAMTVWAASQPVRGMLIEKSFFRAAGTLAGVLFGIMVVWVADGEPVVLVTALSLWVGLCAGAGNVLRGFVAYGTILAGYSASMVALLDTEHPDRILALGLDRFLTALVGVLVALAVGLLLTPKDAADAVVGRTRNLTARVLRLVAARLGPEADPTPAAQGALLSEIAAVEDALDPHGAGSLRSRRSARSLRAILLAQVQALAWVRGADAPGDDHPVAEALLSAAHTLDIGAPPDRVAAALGEAAARAAGRPALHETIRRLETAVASRLPAADEARRVASASPPVVLHRDWVGARHTLIRATATMLLLGAVWIVTGWSGGPFVLLGTSVMLSVFSSFDDPAAAMRHVFAGQVFGAAAALTCRWLAWPHAASEAQLVAMMMPFILTGILPMAHRRTMAGGHDYNMVMLLLLPPALPLSDTFGNSLATALAVVTAPVVALVAFPANAARRRDMLIGMMVRELQNMAASTDAPARRDRWRARLYHRMLRLVRWSDKAGGQSRAAAEGAVAVMRVGNAILLLQQLRGAPVAPGIRRGVEAALGRLHSLSRQPVRAGRALGLLAARLAYTAPAEAALIGNAARELQSKGEFFQRGR